MENNRDRQVTSQDLARLFQAEDAVATADKELTIAPTQQVLGIVVRNNQRIVTRFRWGLIPPRVKNVKGSARLINARAETLSQRPAFRVAFQRRRCVIPVLAYYLWQNVGQSKQPYAVVRRDGQPLALAGLWSIWRDPKEQRVIRSCAVITTRANAVVGQLNSRMPIVLPDDAWSDWLDPGNQNVSDLERLLRPIDEGLLRVMPVALQLNHANNVQPRLLEVL